MTSSSQLPLDAFPAWALLNDVSFTGVQLGDTADKGFALVAERELGASEANGRPLLSIPHDLILSAEAVDEYAKVDLNFKQMLEVAGHQSTRKDVMLYLLCHLVHSRRTASASRGVSSTPWTEYIKFLPRPIPVPSMWSEPERMLLNGTSLEVALEAKLGTLANEFDEVRNKTETMPFWNSFLWETGTTSLDDWILADAWYRSRCLELPQVGDAMVPGLDMVNHSASPTAYYEVDAANDVVLLMRPDCTASSGQEVTISYGAAKPAAEMLFSYGFIDRDSTTLEMTLRIEPFPDDPLAKAKMHIFKGPPTVKLSLSSDGETLTWDSQFVYLMCLNEEDGLAFRVLQDTSGGRQLRMLWQEEDVTERAGDFEALIQAHELCEVFKLRVVAVLSEKVGEQLARIRSGPPDDQLERLVAAGLLRHECIESARTLKDLETQVLEAAVPTLEQEKSTLLAHDHVVAYLGSMEDAQIEQGPRLASSNEDDDFS
ncbi:SET domain-containing protein [Purpureocillium lavendulum]|uniref:SET domain-containing protein n=1 Tax=Purpureocillium lavendulum TaxID=1247861 RepID=A0AB34FPC2_9HYPO|nr:SET domain-containing protein [Purpureocillium lavendulum]